MIPDARPSRLLVAAVITTVAAIGAGITIAPAPDPEEPAAPAAASDPPHTLADLPDRLVVERGSWCDRIPGEAPGAALGTEPSDSLEYSAGDRVRFGGARDVSGEFGCRYRGQGSDSARAWVFDPPVSPQRARDLAERAETRAADDCAGLTSAFGDSSVGLRCPDGNGTRVTWQGRFGDAWVTCSLRLTAPAASQVAERADRWCAEVALAGATPSGL